MRCVALKPAVSAKVHGQRRKKRGREEGFFPAAPDLQKLSSLNHHQNV
jgi:hypothetical protein